jgi:hypothetical protein
MLNALKTTVVGMCVAGVTAYDDDMATPNRFISNLIEPIHAKIKHQKLSFDSVPCQYWYNNAYYNFMTSDFNLKTFY